MKKRGRGVRTRQFNPGAGLDRALEQAATHSNPVDTGAAGLGEYVSALRILKGELPGDVAKSRATIRHTSARKRSEFAREIWRRRVGRQSDLSFIRMVTG